MITGVTCSTGAFSRDPDLVDLEEIVAAAELVDADGFELMVYPAFAEDPDRTNRILVRSKLPWASLHTGKNIGGLLSSGTEPERAEGLALLDADLRLAAELGIEVAVLHLWGLPDSDRHFSANLAVLADCLDRADERGVRLAIETIPCIESSPLARVAELRDRDPRCRWTLDLEFLAVHDELDAALADAELLAATEVIHVKDYDGRFTDDQGRRRYLHPGDGTLDLAAVAAAAAPAPSAIRLCLESSSVRDDRSVDLARVNADLALLRSLARRAAA